MASQVDAASQSSNGYLPGLLLGPLGARALGAGGAVPVALAVVAMVAYEATRRDDHIDPTLGSTRPMPQTPSRAPLQRGDPARYLGLDDSDKSLEVALGVVRKADESDPRESEARARGPNQGVPLFGTPLPSFRATPQWHGELADRADRADRLRSMRERWAPEEEQLRRACEWVKTRGGADGLNGAFSVFLANERELYRREQAVHSLHSYYRRQIAELLQFTRDADISLRIAVQTLEWASSRAASGLTRNAMHRDMVDYVASQQENFSAFYDIALNPQAPLHAVALQPEVPLPDPSALKTQDDYRAAFVQFLQRDSVTAANLQTLLDQQREFSAFCLQEVGATQSFTRASVAREAELEKELASKQQRIANDEHRLQRFDELTHFGLASDEGLQTVDAYALYFNHFTNESGTGADLGISPERISQWAPELARHDSKAYRAMSALLDEARSRGRAWEDRADARSLELERRMLGELSAQRQRASQQIETIEQRYQQAATSGVTQDKRLRYRNALIAACHQELVRIDRLAMLTTLREPVAVLQATHAAKASDSVRTGFEERIAESLSDARSDMDSTVPEPELHPVYRIQWR